MIKFCDKLSNEEKEKYIKDINRNINLDTYSKIKDFIFSNDLFVTNVKTNPIKIEKVNSELILDSSNNRWFILCINGKINLLAKKNVIIHTDMFEYSKRDTSFTKEHKIKKLDYFIEYIDNVGANLTLNLSNYSGKIGKQKWADTCDEISQMTLELFKKEPLQGFTYNGNDFSMCSIGKDSGRKKSVLC